MVNLSFKIDELCERIIDTGLHADILNNLNWKSLSETILNDPGSSAKREFVQAQEGILHNVVIRIETKAREAFRNCRAVDIVQKFHGVTKEPVIFLFSFDAASAFKSGVFATRPSSCASV